MMMRTIIFACVVASSVASECINLQDSKLELVWLLDESGSVGVQNYDKVLNTINNLNLTGFGEVCNGVVEFSGVNDKVTRSKGNKVIDIECDYGVFQDKMKDIKFNKKGWTYTKAAMEYMTETYFVNNVKNDTNTQRVFVVVTDGHPRGRGDKIDGSSDQAGRFLTDATEEALIAGEVDRLVFVSVGQRTNNSMFDDVSIFNPEQDLITTEFDDFQQNIGKLLIDICGVSYPCDYSNILFAVDDSYSITKKEGEISRQLVEDFIFNDYRYLEGNNLALIRFARRILVISNPTIDFDKMKDDTISMLSRWKNGRSRFTKMSNIFRPMKRWSDKFLEFSPRTNVVLISDGNPYLIGRNKKDDYIKECSRWKIMKDIYATKINLVCIKVDLSNTNPTPFYDCICDSYYHYSEDNIIQKIVDGQLCLNS